MTEINDEILENGQGRVLKQAVVDSWFLTVSETGHLHIEGIVTNHPRIPDGHFIYSTRVTYAERTGGRTYLTTRNTRYELLDPDPAFELTYPGFLLRLPEGPVPGYFDLLLKHDAPKAETGKASEESQFTYTARKKHTSKFVQRREAFKKRTRR